LKIRVIRVPGTSQWNADDADFQTRISTIVVLKKAFAMGMVF
jgi:hypothetical protein